MTDRRWFGLNAGASNWLWLGVTVMVLDQWTKWLVRARPLAHARIFFKNIAHLSGLAPT